METPTGVNAMRTIGRILVFVGVCVGVFGVLVLCTKWGYRDYGVRTGQTGGQALFFAIGFILAGVLLCWGWNRPRRRRIKKKRRDRNEKVLAPARRIVLIGHFVLYVAPVMLFIIVIWVGSWNDSRTSSGSWELSSILGLVIVTVLLGAGARGAFNWAVRNAREKVRPDLLDSED